MANKTIMEGMDKACKRSTYEDDLKTKLFANKHVIYAGDPL